MKYCESIYCTKRWKTREVMVGNVGVGGDNPIRIQSMTTSGTQDVEATTDQIIRLADAGCEIARVTVQGMKEAEACERIKNGLLKRGYSIPLVADIHFYPPAAMAVAEFVDKVRINPGNFVDKRATFKTITYDDASYAEEIEKIEEKFVPLIEKCKRLKRAMRIGTNHGSLSDRIMNRYGDTPAGMVESALEFARVCRKYDYHDFMYSMKSSNPQVMILAYRLLVAEMIKLGWNYPLHLGVTEAGDGEDGRVKSAMGIGALLLDGIGDTIRVSLTEDPWLEIDPCKRLVAMAKSHLGKGVEPFEEHHRDISQITRRPATLHPSAPLHRDGSVILALDPEALTSTALHDQLGLKSQLLSPGKSLATVDGIYLNKAPRTKIQAEKVKKIQQSGIGFLCQETLLNGTTVMSLRHAIDWLRTKTRAACFALACSPNSSCAITVDASESEEQWASIKELEPLMILLSPKENRLHSARRFFEWMQTEKLSIPIILQFNYSCSKEDLVIHAAAEMGALLCDGLGEGILLEGPYEANFLRLLSFNILQAARMRTSKTEFISCPSCGRTLFNLQEVTQRIRSRTAHLPGVKIAIMGCIVNGPGEMADADFGYVGSKPEMVDLYVGKECVQRNIPFAEADERLVQLIKAHDRWTEPEEASHCDPVEKL